MVGGDDARELVVFACRVCGDNWLCVEHEEPGEDARITFVHQLGSRPSLKRVLVGRETSALRRGSEIGEWTYLIDDEPVSRRRWSRKLRARRRLLRAMLNN